MFFVLNSLFVSLLLLQFAMCEIRFAFTMFRHGARNPELSLNANHDDPLGEHWSAPGELTPVGMRMHYLLGHRNRVKYQGFLSSSFSANEVYVKSSDFNRTIMSAMSQLQGLFPPGTGPELNDWQQKVGVPPTNDYGFKAEQDKMNKSALPEQVQVFPIHLFDRDRKSNFFFYNPYVCSPFAALFSKNQNQPRFVEFGKKFEELWGNKIRKAMNIEKDTTYFNNYMNLFNLMDTFVSAYTDGRKLQSMLDAGIDLAAFNKTAYEFHFNDILYNWNGDEQKWFARISMSAVIPDVLRWMTDRISADLAGKGYSGYKTPKYVMFSAHDVTLGSAQTVIDEALKIDNVYYTPYASSLFFELHRPDGAKAATLTENDYTVKVIYNDHDLKTLSFPQFRDALKPTVLTDAEVSTFCQWTPAPTSFAFLKKHKKSSNAKIISG